MKDRTYAQPPGPWTQHAACKGRHDLFLLKETASHRNPPHRRYAAQIAIARHICDSCPVLAECRSWALTYPDPAYDHIAGGLTPRERHVARTRPRHGL